MSLVIVMKFRVSTDPSANFMCFASVTHSLHHGVGCSMPADSDTWPIEGPRQLEPMWLGGRCGTRAR